MGDMPQWRVWANSAFANIMKNKHARAPKLYKCSRCVHSLTKNQANKNQGICTHCRSHLKGYKK